MFCDRFSVLIMKFNRKKFFDLYRAKFGGLNQKTVEGLDFFLNKFEVETRLKNIPQYSYVLATTYHESGKDGVHFQPVKEGRASKSRQPALYAQQNKYWLTGFYGRGFPQTTWKTNYQNAGRILGKGDLFVQNPDLLLNPEYAYEVMVVSMVQGLYRKGHSLDRYLNGKTKDYFNAREIINRDKNKIHGGNIVNNGTLIANYARTFEEILKDSLIKDSAAIPAVKPAVVLPNGTTGEPIQPAVENEQGAIELPPEQAETIPNAAIKVPQVKPDTISDESLTEKIEKTAGTVKAWYVAVPGAILSAAGGFWERITSGETSLVFWLIGIFALIVIIYFAANFWLKNQREKRAAAERDSETALRLQREQQAFELQKLTLESAMRRDLNTVVISPQPIETSEEK